MQDDHLHFVDMLVPHGILTPNEKSSKEGSS